MTMTRRHFEALAHLIGTSGAYHAMQHFGFIEKMCKYLSGQNSRFDSWKFHYAIEKWRKESLESGEVL